MGGGGSVKKFTGSTLGKVLFPLGMLAPERQHRGDVAKQRALANPQQQNSETLSGREGENKRRAELTRQRQAGRGLIK